MKQYWLTIAALGLLLILAGCQMQPTPETPWGELQPRTGGMVLPLATPAQPAVREAGLPSTTPRLLQVGQEVTLVGVDHFRLYADADLKAPVLNLYVAGDKFVVIEPSDVITTYPVMKEGRTWYRVRTSDGLVGWVLVDAVVPVDAE